KKPLPVFAIRECIEHIDNEFPNGIVHVQRAAWSGATSRWLDHKTRSWTRSPAASYPLLEAVSKIGSESVYLTKIWAESKLKLQAIIDEGLLEETDRAWT